MKTATKFSQAPKLLDFYEEDVLPALFDQLDRAFPEFKWTRVDSGWDASRNPFSDRRPTIRGRIVCRQPWGFVGDEGASVSWLAYANGGRPPVEYEIVSAVRKLADLAGVDDSAINRPFTSEEIHEAYSAERQRELLEAFIAYCHVALYSPEGGPVRNFLTRVHGLDSRQIGDSTLGLYTSPADVYDYLASVGFTADEIHDSKVTRDTRLDGRLLVPWRDACGRVQSIVAYAATADGRGRAGRLHLKGRGGQEAFGLDVALRNESGGREDLLLVEGQLQVVFFQSLGVANVASFGTTGRTPTREQWERLSDAGVTKVTLAYQDDRDGQQRTLAAIQEANRARRCPELFVVPPDSFAAARSPATFARLNGQGQLQRHLDQRIHAFHFVAQMLIRKHRPGIHWTDNALVDVLNDAIRYDAVTYRPDRGIALDRFFWPHIIRATGADWDIVRGRLRRTGNHPSGLPAPIGSWELLDFRRLLRELTYCIEANRIDQFKAIICAAADAIRGQKPRKKTAVRARPHTVVVPRRPRARVRRPVEEIEPFHVVPMKRPAEPAPAARRPEEPLAALKSTPPLSLDVPTLAYFIWEQKGRPDDADQQCWYEAEQLLAKMLAEQTRKATSFDYSERRPAA